MRLDTYLAAARLFKRRSLAKAACESGAVGIEGRPAKASSKVRPGDVLVIDFPSARCTVEVAALPSQPTKRAEAPDLYVLLSREPRREDLLEESGRPAKG